MNSKTNEGTAEVRDGLTRRTFLGAGAAGGAALLTGGFASIVEARRSVRRWNPHLARKNDPATSMAHENGAADESRADEGVSEAN